MSLPSCDAWNGLTVMGFISSSKAWNKDRVSVPQCRSFPPRIPTTGSWRHNAAVSPIITFTSATKSQVPWSCVSVPSSPFRLPITSTAIPLSNENFCGSKSLSARTITHSSQSQIQNFSRLPRIASARRSSASAWSIGPLCSVQSSPGANAPR